MTAYRATFGVPFTGLASLLIGLQTVLWSLIPLLGALGLMRGQERSLLIQVLHESGDGLVWSATMLAAGIWLSVASLTLRRTWRHAALAVMAPVQLASFVLFAHAGVITPISLTFVLSGLYCVVLLVFDVAGRDARLKEAQRGGS